MENQLTTQLINAISRTDNKGLEKGKPYLFSFQVGKDGIIRIITTNDIEIYYANANDFILSWDRISSLGYANDEDTFVNMIEELKKSAQEAASKGK